MCVCIVFKEILYLSMKKPAIFTYQVCYNVILTNYCEK